MTSQSPNSEPFPIESFDQLAEAEAGHWWFRARNRLLLWVLQRKVKTFNRFLEIGCGTGFVLNGIRSAFPNAELAGSEYFEEGLVHARRRIPTATFTQLDACEMSEKECYDAIGAFDVIEHIERDELVLTNLFNALRPGGYLLLTVPQHQWLWSIVDEHACHVRRYSQTELKDKVLAAGLKPLYVTSFVSLLVPLMYLSRLRARQDNHDPMSEFKIPGWMNWVLEQVMRVEHLLLKLKIRFPIGGSLLMLARKA